jgi:hypothetical protein
MAVAQQGQQIAPGVRMSSQSDNLAACAPVVGCGCWLRIAALRPLNYTNGRSVERWRC